MGKLVQIMVNIYILLTINDGTTVDEYLLVSVIVILYPSDIDCIFVKTVNVYLCQFC